MRTLSILIALLLASGCAKETPTIHAEQPVAAAVAEPHEHAPLAAPRISAADLQEAIDAGTAIALDVRSREQFDALHIRGAVNIPLGELPQRLGELPRDKMIAAYCT